MNIKLLIPTYRNRYVFVKKMLDKYAKNINQGLHLGSGEGDYDRLIAPKCQQLVSCDINEGDVAFAAQLNKDVPNISYQVENALDLSFNDTLFDLVLNIEVIEHVGQPKKMMEEVHRVLKNDAQLIMTFPSEKFPLTYDPINKIRRLLNKKPISQGAYAFGHDYLIHPHQFEKWIDEIGFEIIAKKPLGGLLVGLLEAYWTGWVQKIFKSNSANLNEKDTDKSITIRPSTKEPLIAKLTDLLLAIDRIFILPESSIGMGYVLRKKY